MARRTLYTKRGLRLGVSAIAIVAVLAVIVQLSSPTAAAQTADSPYELVSVDGSGQAVGAFYDPMVSADGSTALFRTAINGANTIYVWQESTGIAELLATGTHFALSDNGRFAAVDGTLFDLELGTSRPWPGFEIDGLTSTGVSPRGISDDGTIGIARNTYRNTSTGRFASRNVRHDLAADTGVVLPGTPASDPTLIATPTADGRYVLLNGAGGLQRYDAQNDTITVIDGQLAFANFGRRISGDGRDVVFYDGGRLYVRDMDSGTDALIATRASTRPWITTDGRYVMYTSSNGETVNLFDRQTQSSRVILDEPALTGANVRFSLAIDDAATTLFFQTDVALSDQDTNGREDMYRIDISEGQPGSTCDGRAVTVVGAGQITGTPGNDVILGSPGADVIEGRGGDDVICAGGGDDVVRGGAGADRIFAGAGADRVNGQGGNDMIFGGSGADVLYGNAGDDQFGGGPGDDRLIGGPGADTLGGGAGDDWCRGSAGADRYFLCEARIA